MGSASSVAPAPPVPEEPTASGCSLIGDCLSVRSRGDRWVRARVAATVDTETRGRLLAVHLEGGKRGALMWLHRELDAARIRPLAGADTPPPPVARGGDTESTFGRAVALVRWRLLKGARWAATRYDATAVFKDSRRVRIDLPSEDWPAHRPLIPRAPASHRAPSRGRGLPPIGSAVSWRGTHSSARANALSSHMRASPCGRPRRRPRSTTTPQRRRLE